MKHNIVNRVLLALLLLLPLGAGAQRPHRHSIELTWGASIPVGSHFVDNSGLSSFSLGWEYRILSHLAVGISAGLDHHSESGHTNDYFRDDFVSGYSERQLLNVSLLAHVRYYPLGRRSSLFRPYLGAGIGSRLSRFDITGDMINTSRHDSWGLGTSVEVGTRIYPCRDRALFFDVRAAYRYGSERWEAARVDGLQGIYPSIGVGLNF